MFSIDEGGRASLIDATSKAEKAAVCPNHIVRANNRFIIETLSVYWTLCRGLKSKRVGVLSSDTKYIVRRYITQRYYITKKIPECGRRACPINRRNVFPSRASGDTPPAPGLQPGEYVQ